MLDYFTPEDNERDEIDYHKQVRAQVQQPTTTADDREFTIEETRYAVERMDNKKAPEQDGITGHIYNHTFTKTHNRNVQWMIKRRVFPKTWKRTKLIPIIKPGKEYNYEVSKYRPISLLNFGGKVQEEVMISRINQHVYTNDCINKANMDLLRN
jgi:hypothetical protein